MLMCPFEPLVGPDLRGYVRVLKSGSAKIRKKKKREKKLPKHSMESLFIALCSWQSDLASEIIRTPPPELKKTPWAPLGRSA